MLSTSVWNLSNFWKGVARASIYLMIFLAFAMLVLPLIETQEAEAVPVRVPIGAFVVGVIVLGITIYKLFCKKYFAQVSNSHYVSCNYEHPIVHYYSCDPGERWKHGACNSSNSN